MNLHCCCGCVLGPMGWTYGATGPYGDFSIFMYGAAVPDLWGSMGNPDFDRGCGLGPMGHMELRCQTYGDPWLICIVAVAAVSDLWGESMGL